MVMAAVALLSLAGCEEAAPEVGVARATVSSITPASKDVEFICVRGGLYFRGVDSYRQSFTPVLIPKTPDLMGCDQ